MVLAVYNIEGMKVNNHEKDVNVDFYIIFIAKVSCMIVYVTYHMDDGAPASFRGVLGPVPVPFPPPPPLPPPLPIPPPVVATGADAEAAAAAVWISPTAAASWHCCCCSVACIPATFSSIYI